MSELLIRIEETCLQVESVRLLLPGLIATVLGLFLWLGGAKYSAIVIGLLGGACGALGGFMVSQWFSLSLPLATILGAVILALAAVLLQQMVIILLATVIFAAICGFTYLSYSVDDQSWNDSISAARAQALDQVQPYLDTEKTAGTAREKISEIFDDIKAVAGDHSGSMVIWALIGAGIGLICAYFLKRIMMALCCSIVGTTAIISGMILLLFAKETEVFTALQSRPQVLPTVFIAMVAFGWLVQLFLSSAPKTAKADDDENENDDSD